ncbi:uncharacterized protein E0L32_004225 [Thyridium curvatum]|uniref:G-protein coupled receptors family 2 profile 2 domain-containing protein n=1 Tax=Thyridium curvatum TaxID=1093900 RepID=A0A507BI19_9PEZI|nr:uncharacterized protein E0L32_004225 [Thyridium curvatum]TPX16230.1 hypothetical protein E0L32_004225 [Thyridium curvatum]
MDVSVTAENMLSQDEVQVIVSLERAGASLSLVGVTLIFLTFAIYKKLRTVPNTFILFASIANVGASVASLIGYAGIAAGVDSNLCKAQAFLLEIYYIPIWMCIVLSAVIYMAVGYHVFHQRNQLRNLTLSNQGKSISTSDVRDSAEKNLTASPSAYPTVTHDIEISTEVYDTFATPPPTPSPSTTAQCPWAASGPQDDDSIVSSTSPRGYPAGATTTPHHHHHHASHHHHPGFSHVTSKIVSSSSASASPHAKDHQAQSRRGSGGGTTSATASWRRRLAARLRHMDPVKLAYLRTSFVFAVSVLVTWTPSSINRVYNLVYPDRVSYGLNLASAVVLPLQGVWNAVIYFTTSWRTVREEGARTWEGRRRARWWPSALLRSSGSRGARAARGSGGGGLILPHIRSGGGGACGMGMGGRGGGHVVLDSAELEMSPRAIKAPPPVGTLRVQKGCELDSL